MATQPEPTSQPRIPLSRQRVLSTAIRLADEGGIESLTMRKLAQALGVEAMSLYNHVANKGDLVDGIVDRVVSEIELPAGDEDWETAVRTGAISANQAFLRHPWACSLVIAPIGRPTTLSARMRYVEWLLGALRRGGFPAELAYHAYHALDSYILGFTFWQLGHSLATKGVSDLVDTFLRDHVPADEFPYLVEHIHQHLDPTRSDDVSEFEFGLELILDGLKRARDAT